MIVRLYQFLVWSLGYLLIDLYRTVNRVIGREPLLKPEVEGLSPVEIARVCMQSCLEERRVGPRETATVLCAGFRHFREPWARDFGFASFGLLAEGRGDVVRDGVKLFFRHQRANGQLPLKLHSTNLLERYLHSFFARVQPVDSGLIPKFISAHGTRSLDSVLLILIAWGECVEQTDDTELAIDLHGQAVLALEWVQRYRGDNGLLNQGPFSDWADSIGRSGAVLYTNVLWWKALLALETVEKRLPHVFSLRRESAAEVGSRILEQLYDESRGYLRNSPSSPIFTTAGNAMAVAWGLTNPEQSSAILDYAKQKGMGSPVPSRVTDREYPFYLVGPEMWIAGIRSYHTSCSWMWIGGWHAVACYRAGRAKEARELVQAMLATVERDRTVYEVHDRQGKPLATRLYHSEEPLSWNAAVLLYAYHEVEMEGPL